MQKNKFVKTLFALFIMVIVIVSYTTIFSNNGVSSTSTTTAAPGPTVFATGTSNAAVTGYAPIMNISVKCPGSSATANVFSKLSNGIATLEANNSVATFYPVQYNLSIESGNANVLQIYGYEYGLLNSSTLSCATFSTVQFIELPAQVILTAEAQKVSVPLNGRNYTLPVILSQSMNSIVQVKIAALLTQSGTLYGNLSLTRI